jgi:hypothetical protein
MYTRMTLSTKSLTSLTTRMKLNEIRQQQLSSLRFAPLLPWPPHVQVSVDGLSQVSVSKVHLELSPVGQSVEQVVSHPGFRRFSRNVAAHYCGFRLRLKRSSRYWHDYSNSLMCRQLLQSSADDRCRACRAVTASHDLRTRPGGQLTLHLSS